MTPPIYVGIVSDSHGRFHALEKMVEQAPDVSAWIHCGDYCDDGDDLAAYTGIPVYTVKGNNDFMSLSNTPECRKVVIGGVTMVAVHGHQWYSSRRLDRLTALGQQYHAALVAFGHTHRRFCEQIGCMMVVNPGSISLPRDGCKGSYAICTIADENLADVQIYDLK